MSLRPTFSIFDSKAKLFLPPFLSANSATATREFQQAINNDGGQFNKYAEDYSLFFVGDWDEEKGHHLPAAAPDHICNAISLKQDPRQMSQHDEDIINKIEAADYRPDIRPYSTKETTK